VISNNVLAVAHRKGGVGKTTTIVHLATGIASLGVPTVAIDLDPQGNLGEFLGLGRASDVYDLLMSRRPERILQETLTAVPGYPKLRVILGDDETKAAERALGAPESRRTLVSALHGIVAALDALAGENGRLPYVLLDTPPGLGSLQLAALTVANHLIIPINPSFASETGIPKMAEEIQAIRQRSGRGARLLGILPTRYKQRTLEHQAILDGLRATFGESAIYPPVRDTVRLEEAPGRGLPIWDYDRHSGGAKDYARVLVRLMRDVGIRVNGNGRG
jgi:chromosome partitioning protein